LTKKQPVDFSEKKVAKTNMQQKKKILKSFLCFFSRYPELSKQMFC